MFWRWDPEWQFFETEPGQHESVRHLIDQQLARRTFWGDYVGSTIERFHMDYLEENAGHVVQRIEAGHGSKGLITSMLFTNPAYRDEARVVLEFLSFFDPNSPNYGHDYPIYDEWSWSDWEWELSQKELQDGWLGKSLIEEWEWYLTHEVTEDWDHILPEQGSEEFWDVLEHAGATEYGPEWSVVWEGADSAYLEQGPTNEEVIDYLLSKVGPSYEQDEKLPGFV